MKQSWYKALSHLVDLMYHIVSYAYNTIRQTGAYSYRRILTSALTPPQAWDSQSF